MNRYPPPGMTPATPPTGNAGAAPASSSPRTFPLYTDTPVETADTLAARRALMSRKSLSVEELGARARERRREAGRIQRFDARARWLALALPAAGALAWFGSAQGSVATLVAGYTLLASGIVALLAYLTRAPEAARLPLECYYRPEEQLASADDIALLRRLAQQDGELDAATAAWWRNPAPIRRGDVQLALDFHRARQK